MHELLFVYGTLRDPKVQLKVIGRSIEGAADSLDGYTKSIVTIDGNVYPIIIAGGERAINGMVLKVTKEELEKMDVYETAAYKRTKVTLKSGKSAWVYQKP